MLPLDASVLQQPAQPQDVCVVQRTGLPLDVSVVQQPVLPLDVSVIQKTVLPLYMSVLQQPIAASGRGYSAANCAVSEHVCSTAACAALSVSVLSQPVQAAIGQTFLKAAQNSRCRTLGQTRPKIAHAAIGQNKHFQRQH